MATNIDTNLLSRLGLSQQKKSQDDAPKNHLGQNDFLKLMITQLRNQDPFKPMDSGQFLGQLAQFGTVNGIAAMQKSIGELAGAMQGSQTLQAASLVDRHVWVNSHEAWLPPSGTLNARVQIPDGAKNVSVSVYDLHGQRVADLSVDAENANSVTWNGLLENGTRAEPGFYELKASGNLNGQTTAFKTVVSGQVESVSRKAAGDGLQLTVTGVGVVNLNDVREIS